MVHPYNEEFLARQAAHTKPHRLAFYRHISLGTISSVLEIGSGSGEIIGEIAIRSPALCFGIDSDPRLVQIAREHHPKVDFKEGRGENLPFADQQFDLVLAHFALMWCLAPQTVIREMYRVCKSGGWVAAMGEPDYGGYITHPSGYERTEEEGLKKLNANTRLGREIGSYFRELAWRELQWGVLGANEKTLQEDALIISGTKLVYLPIFWVWGRKI